MIWLVFVIVIGKSTKKTENNLGDILK